MNLEVSKREVGGVTVVDIRGRIIFGEECNFLRSAVKEIIGSLNNPLILNLQNVSYVDSGGIGTLVGLFTSAHAAGCDLKLACPNEKVKHVLEITKLMPILGVYSNEERAIAAVQPRASA